MYAFTRIYLYVSYNKIRKITGGLGGTRVRGIDLRLLSIGNRLRDRNLTLICVRSP